MLLGVDHYCRLREYIPAAALVHNMNGNERYRGNTVELEARKSIKLKSDSALDCTMVCLAGKAGVCEVPNEKVCVNPYFELTSKVHRDQVAGVQNFA